MPSCRPASIKPLLIVHFLQDVQSIHTVLAAILHIGNIEFLTEMGATDLAAVITDPVRSGKN